MPFGAQPNFYLTAAGEFAPLAWPRGCWVIDSLRDREQNEYLLVGIRPPFRASTSSDEISRLLLSARHRGVSISHIQSSPVHVTLSHAVAPQTQQSLDRSKLETFSCARLYLTLDGAMSDAEEHAAAVRRAASPELFQVPQVRFLGEQDGTSEQLLKDALRPILHPKPCVSKAYLAQTDYGEETPRRVTLCLRSASGPDDDLVKQIGQVFARIFRTSESLDILFVDSEHERELAQVCKPFYVHTVRRRTF